MPSDSDTIKSYTISCFTMYTLLPISASAHIWLSFFLLMRLSTLLRQDLLVSLRSCESCRSTIPLEIKVLKESVTTVACSNVPLISHVCDKVVKLCCSWHAFHKSEDILVVDNRRQILSGRYPQCHQAFVLWFLGRKSGRDVGELSL